MTLLTSGEGSVVMFYVLCILLLIAMVAIFIGPIVIFVLIFKGIAKKSEQMMQEENKKIIQIHEENARIEQEKIDIRKRKFKRTRCVYCGTLNPIDNRICTQCGGTLTGIDAMDDNKEIK